jgi:gliding motility-associated-like protein
LSIYNRWGQKLFYTTNPEIGWDGTFEGSPVPQGAYAFYVNAIFLTGKRLVQHGDITIIR